MCWIRNPLVKTHGALNVILEALMLVVIQTGNLALTHLTNEIAGIIAYECRITSITYKASRFVNYFYFTCHARALRHTMIPCVHALYIASLVMLLIDML